jgi:hypothetical protein
VTAVAESAPSAPVSLPYMARPLMRTLVIGTFFFVTLPLAAYVLVGHRSAGDAIFEGLVPQAYLALFGYTHFALTFTIFFSAANRAHFTSTRRNLFVFLIAPGVPFLGLMTWYGLALNERYRVANELLFFVITAFNYYHLTRQAFGVLQLFKGKAMRAMPPWIRTAENLFLLSLTAQMLVTYTTDLHFDPSRTITWLVLPICVVLFLVVCAGYGMGIRAGCDRRQTLTAFAYLMVQALGAVLTIASSALYIATLAVHYVEYHVVMAPRVLKGPSDSRDTTLALFRRAPLALYAVLAAAAVGLWLMIHAQRTYTTGGPRFLVHLFDGIFVFHYIVEMSIWKFSDPYFRKALGPLYA